jgi:hypothetical protein
VRADTLSFDFSFKIYKWHAVSVSIRIERFWRPLSLPEGQRIEIQL